MRTYASCFAVLAVAAGCSAQMGDHVGQSGEAVGAGTVYNFGTLAHAGSCMDAYAAGTADGTQIQEYECNGTAAQSYELVAAANGAFSLLNTHANKCVDANAWGTTDGTKIQLWDCNGGANQAFDVEDAGNGFVTFVNVNSGKCLDVSGDNPADGTVVQLWDCNGTNAQKWNPAVIGQGTSGGGATGGGSTGGGSTGGGSTGGGSSSGPTSGNGSNVLISVTNKCPVDLWINAVNNPAAPASPVTLTPNNVDLAPGSTQRYLAPNDWPAARINAFFEAPDGNGNPQGQSDKVELTLSSSGGVTTANTDITYVDWVALPSQIQVTGSGSDCTTVGCDVPYAQILDGCPASLVSGKECISAGSYCLNPNNNGDPYCHVFDGEIGAVSGAGGSTTAQVYSCSGSFFSQSSEYCSALNRGVLSNPNAPSSSYYESPPFNTYSQWVHERCPGIYAFPYDDYGPSNQSSDHSCTGVTEVAVTFCPGG